MTDEYQFEKKVWQIIFCQNTNYILHVQILLNYMSGWNKIQKS